MKTTSSRLAATLAKKLASAYLFVNSEPVLLSEDRDLVRRKLACDERHLFLVERDFDFATARAEATAGNLFGETVLLEFICSDPLGAAMADNFMTLAATAIANDILLMVACPALARQGKWTEQLEKSFTLIRQDEVPPNQMIGWVKARAAQTELQVDDEAAELIASMCEGNLSMAAQELSKLAMIHGAGAQINLHLARAGIADQTRDSIASLRAAMAAGDTARAIRALRNMQAAREATPLIVWALAEEGRALLNLANGNRPWGIFGSHRTNLQQLANRVRQRDVHTYLAGVARADWTAKGLLQTDPWICFERLATAFTCLARHNQLPEHLILA